MRSLPAPVRVFKALGDEQRLRILEVLASGDAACCAPGEGLCGCDLQERLGLAQATISHHMSLLVQAGLVSSEKRGKWVHYALKPAGFQAARDFADAFAAHAANAAPGRVA